jgi:nucleotide-binding universal stress UspA family protein
VERRTLGTVATPPPVLVGVDGSPASLGAVRWAAHEAAPDGLPLLIVHGGYFAHVFGLPASIAPTNPPGPTEHTRTAIESALAVGAAAEPDVTVTSAVDPSEPIGALVERGRRAALVGGGKGPVHR